MKFLNYCGRAFEDVGSKKFCSCCHCDLPDFADFVLRFKRTAKRLWGHFLANLSHFHVSRLWDIYCKRFGKKIISSFFAVCVARLLLTVAALAIYVFAKSLKTHVGKSEFMLLLGIFFLQVMHRLRQTDIFKDYWNQSLYALIASLLMMFFWTFALIFDIWWTFRWFILIKINDR